MIAPTECSAALATVIEDEILRQVAASGLDAEQVHKVDGFRLWDEVMKHLIQVST